MSRENVELVQAVIDATERRDWDAVYARYAPDIVLDFTRTKNIALPRSGEVFRGHEAWRRTMREFNEAWETVGYEHEGLLDAGDRVVHLLSQRVIGRTTHLEFAWSYAQVWTVRGGLLTRMDYYEDRAEALEAAGLSE